MLDIFFHPVGFVCSLIWFMLCVWVAIKLYVKLFGK
jgi:hypothetical protein